MEQFIRGIDAHYVLEAHLPSVIPFAVVDHILIPVDIFDQLDGNAKDMLSSWFRDDQIIKTSPVGPNYSTWPVPRSFFNKGYDPMESLGRQEFSTKMFEVIREFRPAPRNVGFVCIGTSSS